MTRLALLLALAGCASERRGAWPDARAVRLPSASAPVELEPARQYVSTRRAGPEEGDASRAALLVGVRSLDGSDWGPVDDQFMMGGDFAYEPADSVFGFECGLTASYDKHGDVEAGVGEVHAGLRRTFARRSSLQPYVGFGVSAANLHVDGPGVADDDDQTFAGYAHGGLVLFVSDAFFLGVDVRRMFGSDIDLDGVPGDIDSTVLALVIGAAL